MSSGARWDGWARAYDRGMAPLERWPLRRWRAGVRRWLAEALGDAGPEPTGGGRPPLVLEVGAGTGRNRLPGALAARVVAVDRSADMLRRARARGYERAIVADAEALPFREETFAAGAETLVWCEVARPVEALSEVRRVLAPGATFVMLDHVRPPGPAGWLADALSRVTGPWMDEWWNRDTRRYARPSGFRLAGSEDAVGGAVRTLRLVKAPEPDEPGNADRDESEDDEETP